MKYVNKKGEYSSFVYPHGFRDTHAAYGADLVASLLLESRRAWSTQAHVAARDERVILLGCQADDALLALAKIIRHIKYLHLELVELCDAARRHSHLIVLKCSG